MTDQHSTASVRWWRRNRDLALQAVQAAHAAAGEAMLGVDALQRDLPGLVATHQAGGTEVRTGRGSSPNLVTREWEPLAARINQVMSRYLDVDARYDRDADLDEGTARSLTAQFEAVTAELRALVAPLEQFRARHQDVLAAAHNLTLAAPRTVQEAQAAVQAARRTLDEARQQGLVDPGLDTALTEAAGKLAQAHTLVEQRSWAAAQQAAAAAGSTARAVQTKAARLPEEAAKVRRGFASVRTRREALQTQHDRLAPVMSDLRRRYTYSSWKHIDDAPARIDAALDTVTDGLARLERALAQVPLEVPAATLLLQQIRAAASEVDAILKTATGTVARLDAVAADPERLLVDVRRKTVDARRFLAGLPADRAPRYASTLDSLAARTERLAAAARGSRPDWGAIIAEAEAIEAGLDAMIRTARSG